MTRTYRTAAIEGAFSAAVQALFQDAVVRWRGGGIRVVGVIEEAHGLAGRTCSAGLLRDIASGVSHPIYLEVPPHDTSCHIDAAGAEGAGRRPDRADPEKRCRRAEQVRQARGRWRRPRGRLQCRNRCGQARRYDRIEPAPRRLARLRAGSGDIGGDGARSRRLVDRIADLAADRGIVSRHVRHPVAVETAYSLVSLLLLGWLVGAAGRAPFVELWGKRWIACATAIRRGACSGPNVHR
jgi:hypothetical protein